MTSAVSKFCTLWVCLSFSIFYLPSLKAAPSQVAIVIDDIGYRNTDMHALSLPGEITYSILPHTPYGKALALQANAQQKDVMLHIPMEAENGKKLGPGALTSVMNEAQIINSLNASLAEIPFAIGINNHMGSRLTQLREPMTWTMNFLKQHNLLFLDSKTSLHSKAGAIAKNLGVPVNRRHIFLDNRLTQDYINKQFQLLVQRAKNQEFTIAIAHPHPETILALKQLIPTLRQNNIQLVPLSTLYSTKKNDPTSVVNSM
jgi:polysaccharide deacetylase 2 family uncharacterized protein YibQ